MSNGIQLTLMIGPGVPVPVPDYVTEALTSVEVTVDTGGTSGFQLQFQFGNRSPLQARFLMSSAVDIPFVRVIIVVTFNGQPHVLMDGMMTNHEVTTDAAGGHSTLTLTGTDLSVVMSYIDFSGIPYPAMAREARVALIIAKYAVLGIVPRVIPSIMIDVPLPTSKIPGQRGTDLGYVKRLASEVGYVFYVDAGPRPGMSVAYWGPEIKVGVPQPALSINMDAHTNVESLSFQFAKDKKVLPIVWILNEETRVPIPIPIPNVTPLNPPLGLFEPAAKQVRPIETSGLTPLQGAMIGLAQAARSADVVSAQGELNVVRYGRVLRARGLVGVRGAGLAYDGLYYVKKVTHKIKRGEYKQSFELSRNGIVSTLPRVIP